MAEAPKDTQGRFLDRIERRVVFLKTLQDAGLGVYLPADEQQRKRAIEMAVRLTARQSELPDLTPDTLARAFEIVRAHLEATQKVLPHDVQYRNRVRQTW
jgi:hypothetical protein